MKTQDGVSRLALEKHISPIGAWALSIGTTIGWGSMVVTGNTYLSHAGPLGSSLGILFGMLVMLLIARNYYYMLMRYPESGGGYTYVKVAFGYDYGFLTAWFMMLTYVAIFWANATSVPLFARYFFGDVLRFGFHYSIFNYEIYFGEILITIVAILLIGLLCIKCKRLSVAVVIAMALVFTIGIAVCFAVSVGRIEGAKTLEPLFVPGGNIFAQVMSVASMSSWAFIGFENISHSAEEFKFAPKKVFRIFSIAIVISTALYIFVMLLSVTAYPPEYRSWFEYVSASGSLLGIKALPPFYAVDRYMGTPGVVILIMVLFSLVVTSLIGNMIALSRLIYALAKDGVCPRRFAKLGKNNVPYRAVIAIVAVSVVIPVLGRSAIGWIVDVTTIGATIIYGFVSASTFKIAKLSENKEEMITGGLGVVIMSVFGIMIMVPNLLSGGAMATESYFLFAVLGVLGFIYLRWLLAKHTDSRFGRSMIVWVALLLTILISMLTWMGYNVRSTTGEVAENIGKYYGAYTDTDEQLTEKHKLHVQQQINRINRVDTESTMVVFVLLTFSLCVMMKNFSIMTKRGLEKERELDFARNIANIDSLTGVKTKYAYGVEESRIDAEIEEGLSPEFAVVVFDVNGLKQINDTLGHKAGDEHIMSASRIICDVFKRSPIFRTGGDEFVAILQDRDYMQRESLMRQFNEVIEENKRQNKIVISSGMSEFDPKNDKKVLFVFERADELMYARKKQLKA